MTLLKADGPELLAPGGGAGRGVIVCSALFWLSLAGCLAAYAFLPLFDPDFWWHLKNGQLIVERGALPTTDPFTFTGDGSVGLRERLILRGYWLWQVLAYGCYQLAGFTGINGFNLLVAALLGGGTFLGMRRLRVDPAVGALLASAGFFVFIRTYTLERPQTISFALTVLLLGLFYRFRRTSRFDWRLPLLMLLWANLHGGFVVGAILLLLFGATALIVQRRDRAAVRHIGLWTAAGLAATLLNPNGFGAFEAVATFYNSSLMNNVLEYQSTFSRFAQGGHYLLLLWGLIALYYGALLVTRRCYAPELVVMLFLTWFALAHVRNVGLLVPAALPAIGHAVTTAAAGRRLPGSRFLRPALILVCAGLAGWLTWDMANLRFRDGAVRQAYPERAVEFLQTSGLRGNLFNSYEYGGYLIWRVAPEIKVFIDGRGLDARVFADYGKIAGASKKITADGLEYEALLGTYGIDLVFQQIYQGDGSIQPLMLELLQKPDWVPVYQDNFVYIFSRATADNAAAIDRYGMTAGEFQQRLLLRFGYLVRQYPQEIGYQIARAGLLIAMEHWPEARRQLDSIRTLAPGDPALINLERNFTWALQRASNR